MSITARRMQRSIASSKPHYPTTSLINYGLSMAGPEMGHAAATVPGTLGTNYTYSPLQWYQYACANGLKHFRIPFLAERAEVRLSELMDHVASVLAIDTSVTVTLDMHNYGEKFISGVTQQLGTGWSNAAFAAEWVTIASHATVKNNPRVSFDLMNEANNYIGYATERAEAAALEASEQAAVTALRNAGITNVLKVQPYNWGAARRVADLHPSWWINDPLNRTIVSAHFYFDYSGAYVKSYADQESDARLAGYPSLESQVSSELAPFITWVNSQTALPAAELGEVGWPVQNEWCALADKTLDQLEASVKPIGWTYWGMNHWWDPGGEGNMMLFTFSGPDTPLNGRLLQADVLDIHLNRSIPKTVTATAPTYSTTSYTIPISFGVNYKCDGTTKLPGTYTASGTVTITAESKSAEFTMTGTTTWTGTLSASTVTTNLVQNPRAVSTGASMLYTNIAWSSTTKQWLTGQTGWANNTSTALAYTSAAANASSGNLISFITQDSASLTGYATGATVPVTIQGSRSQGGSLQLCMSWLDSNGLEISEDMPSAVTVAAGEKRTLTHNATKPSGAVRFDLQMRAPSAKAGEQVAATNFCVGSSTYFDGSTPDTASMTYAWTGTADASTSTSVEVT